MQRTRCSYFRDGGSPCNKRDPGSGCAALEGYNRMHAVLGTSEQCIAAHPSDFAVALVALDATLHVRGTHGARRIGVAELFALPGTTPHVEHTVKPDELITYVDVPAWPGPTHYVKVRDRSEFAFALASAAVAVERKGKSIARARVALGGVGTKPWRAREAEAVLAGKAPSTALFRKAADAALVDARARKHNAFKIELAKRTLVRALEEAL
jgi:xanthine dehydrogenase YagS FAD-binding subunit